MGQEGSQERDVLKHRDPGRAAGRAVHRAAAEFVVGAEKGHVYGLRVGQHFFVVFLIQWSNLMPSAKDTSASGQSVGMVR